MDIEDLRTFVEVASAAGISPAAARLGISESMVSRQLSRLEAELGVQLLARSTRGAALTEAGATFRDHTARVCEEIDTAKETILPDGDLRGRLRVAVPLSFGPTHFAPFACRDGATPSTTQHADLLQRPVRRPDRGRLRLRRSCRLSGGLQPRCQCVGPIHGKLVASPAYVRMRGAPEIPEELMGHEALMQGTEAWQLTDGDRIVTVRPQGRFKADNGMALVAAAVAGIGIGYLPDWLTHTHIASGELVQVMTRHPPPLAGMYVVRPPGQHPTRKIRVVTELLTEYCETLMLPA